MNRAHLNLNNSSFSNSSSFSSCLSTTLARQWYRLVNPIFLHSGLIHLAGNMLIQWDQCRHYECDWGTPKYAFIYLASGGECPDIGARLDGGQAEKAYSWITSGARRRLRINR